MRSAILTHAATRFTTSVLEQDYTFTTAYYNLPPDVVAQHMVRRNEAVLDKNNVPVCRTGKFTGRAPSDRYIVKDALTQKSVDWGTINFPYPEKHFVPLTKRLMQSLTQSKEVFVRDVYACTHPDYRLRVRVISTTAYHNLFARNMFIAVPQQELEQFKPDFTILVNPNFQSHPKEDKTRKENFVILNINKGLVCIGGTGYTGEVKKSIFSILNYLLPLKHNILTMHCSANMQDKGPSALFFGLSGTGKTTLSSDPERALIGDDEHGWDEDGVFNLEGGCYAKVINLSSEKEPLIWDAIKPYALLENTKFHTGTREIDYADKSITENTRVSYPLNHIRGAFTGNQAPHPSDVFFLSCDAFGILPPIALLSEAQAAFYFLCGYTAKIAGTEQGITQPSEAFSPCFGAPFLPLPCQVYADVFKRKIARHKTRVWLVNTGWIGGPYGTGKRIPLKWTRLLLRGALTGQLEKTKQHSILEIAMPLSCPGVPDEILDPHTHWKNPSAYITKTRELKEQFLKQVRMGAPTLT